MTHFRGERGDNVYLLADNKILFLNEEIESPSGEGVAMVRRNREESSREIVGKHARNVLDGAARVA